MEIDKKIIRKLIEVLEDLKKSLKDKEIINIEDAPEDIQTNDERLTLSTQFRKTTRSNNWLLKSTIDNVSNTAR